MSAAHGIAIAAGVAIVGWAEVGKMFAFMAAVLAVTLTAAALLSWGFSA